jgi:hypothetical protein
VRLCLLRQTACARRFLPAMIGSGTWEGAHARHEAAGVRRPARRSGGGVAARGDTETPIRVPFLKALEESGFAAGRNVAIEYRFAEGHDERSPVLAAELVRR